MTAQRRVHIMTEIRDNNLNCRPHGFPLPAGHSTEYPADIRRRKESRSPREIISRQFRSFLLKIGRFPPLHEGSFSLNLSPLYSCIISGTMSVKRAFVFCLNGDPVPMG